MKVLRPSGKSHKVLLVPTIPQNPLDRKIQYARVPSLACLNPIKNLKRMMLKFLRKGFDD